MKFLKHLGIVLIVLGFFCLLTRADLGSLLSFLTDSIVFYISAGLVGSGAIFLLISSFGGSKVQ